MYHIIVQQIIDQKYSPDALLIEKWAEITLSRILKKAEVTIRIVDIEEMTQLNSTYRLKTGPTNVLSFPFTLPDHIPLDVPILGDVVICAPVVNSEAQQQGKTQHAHWAHMVVHGIYHLCGYDHETDAEAKIMESHETATLQLLGFTNPYETHHD